MIGFGNDTLNKQPPLKKGDKITCPLCGEQHTVVAGKDSETGDDTNLVLFYKCEGKTYLAGVAGRSVVGVPSDLSSPISASEVVETYPKPVERTQMPEDLHRKRHEELHLMFDELLADYMLHCPGARPSNTKAIDLMLWSAQQCKSPGGKHPAKASDGALSFNALATAFLSDLSGGDMRKRVGPKPLPPRLRRVEPGEPIPMVVRKCALCGGDGPFRCDEEVAKETGGKFLWTDTCMWCEKGIPAQNSPRGHTVEIAPGKYMELPYDQVTVPAADYNCSEGGKCDFTVHLEADRQPSLRCEKCGCTPEEKARGEK